MHFTSYAFAAFMILLLVLYYAAPPRFRWNVLLAGSLMFVALAGWGYLVYLALTVGSTYAVTRRMKNLRAKRDVQSAAADKEARRALRARTKAVCFRWLAGALVFNFGLMFFFKYFGIAASDALIVRLGVSFYAFQLTGYLIDVYRGKAPAEISLPQLTLFASFFPLLVQGPINRYESLTPSLFAGTRFDKRNLSRGVQRMLWGFFKKLVIADRLAPAMNALMGGADPGEGAAALLGMLLYAVTLYADFTGGVDIAVGAAECFGVRVAENFDRPFYAVHVADYWRRWHMSMSAWFKDYLFYPLSVCKPMLRLSKAAREKLGGAAGKRVTVYLSLFAVWLATGLWHDVTPNYIVWGLVNGLVLLVTQELQPLYGRFRARFAWTGGRGYAAFTVVRTFTLMMFIRAIDRYESVGLAFDRIVSVFTRFDLPGLLSGGLAGLGVDAAGFLAAGLGLLCTFIVSFAQRNGEDARDALALRRFPARAAVMTALIFMILVFGAYGPGFDARQFMYNRF